MRHADVSPALSLSLSCATCLVYHNYFASTASSSFGGLHIARLRSTSHRVDPRAEPGHERTIARTNARTNARWRRNDGGGGDAIIAHNLDIPKYGTDHRHTRASARLNLVRFVLCSKHDAIVSTYRDTDTHTQHTCACTLIRV